MLRILGNPKTLCHGVTRRDLLHIGGLGAFGVALHDWFRLTTANAASDSAATKKFGQAKSCILIYKYGSPPQHETFDPKPNAPAEIQGEMKSIATSVPGIHCGDHLPKIARIMDRLTVVRSLTHPYPLHGTVYATTGIPDVDTKIEAQPRHKRQWPFLGSIVDYLDDQRALRAGQTGLPALPRNIALPFVMGSKNEYPPLAGPYGAMLGQKYDPVFTDFRPEGTRLAPEINPGKAFRDPLLGIRPTDRLELAPQSPGLLPWRTVRANARLLLDVNRATSPADAPDIDALLEEVGLSGFADAYPHQLSGGMQQRVALVRALDRKSTRLNSSHRT